ncbi:MAG: MotA/TolQ/ExbB proton channel family protein [Victivallaceae bacterium]
MDVFAGVKTFLFILSSCVLYPVLLLLAGLSVWIFFECGRLLADWIHRRRLSSDAEAWPVRRYDEALTRLFALAAPEPEIQNLLRRAIQGESSKLDKFRIIARLGPALGLIGTLVPMGTALASLGQGDVSVMTAELVVAYTTTVVGLVIGSVAYLIYTVRRRFADSDIREMEFLTEKRYREIYA